MAEETPLGDRALHRVAVIIPARDPSPLLAELVRALLDASFGHVLVVDDGSPRSSAGTFLEVEAAGAHVIAHAANLGKGRALKTAFGEILRAYPSVAAVVTADADGQHRAEDIVRIGCEVAVRGEPVLGSRTFPSQVPLRSRFGNTLTRYVFAFATGMRLSDTQCGLRALPRDLLPALLTLQGERYEYEMNVLAFLCRVGHPPVEVPIATVYIDGNRSSHFHPIRDSVRIYTVLARILLSRALRACAAAWKT